MGVFLLIRISTIKATEMGRNMAVDSRTWIPLVPCGQGDRAAVHTHLSDTLLDLDHRIFIGAFKPLLKRYTSLLNVCYRSQKREKKNHIYVSLCLYIFSSLAKNQGVKLPFHRHNA